MINLPSGILKAGLQVLGLQIRKFLEDLFGTQPGRKQVQHVAGQVRLGDASRARAPFLLRSMAE